MKTPFPWMAQPRCTPQHYYNFPITRSQTFVYADSARQKMVAMTASWTVPASGAQFLFGAASCSLCRPCLPPLSPSRSLSLGSALPSSPLHCTHAVYRCMYQPNYKACHVPAGVLPPGVRSSGPNEPANPNQRHDHWDSVHWFAPSLINAPCSLWFRSIFNCHAVTATFWRPESLWKRWCKVMQSLKRWCKGLERWCKVLRCDVRWYKGLKKWCKA